MPPELAAEVAAAPLLPAALDLAVVSERTGAPVELAGQVLQCLAERLGLVPLREMVIALPAGPPLAVDGPRLAAGRPRHGAGVAHRGRAVPAHGRHGPAGEAGRRLGGGLGHHPGRARPRSSPTSRSGDRHELAELLVAVRTLRGLRKRRQARRLPRPEK